MSPSKISRRLFMLMIPGAAAAAGMAVSIFSLYPGRRRALSLQEARAMPEKRKKPVTGKQMVSLRRCTSYDPDRVYEAVTRSLADITFKIPAGSRVLLKPNIIAQNTPEQAATTHPAVIDALCRWFSDHGCSVSIGDSSAFYQGGCTRAGLETSGMRAVAEKYGARLVPFETTLLKKITGMAYLDPLYITSEVFENDLVVNVPKLKVHRLARVTGAIKNMYGCVVGGTKQIYHTRYQGRPDYKEFWGKPLVDVYQAVSPGLTVMDAVVGLDRDGPAATGDPRLTGHILASRSGPALDIAACRLIGVDPVRVPAVREAVDRGLASEKGLDLAGDLPFPVARYTIPPDEKPKKGFWKKIDDYAFQQFIVEPRISRDRCTRCGDCVNQCAAGAIAYNKKGDPVIDYSRCIYCYCCEEYCAPGAVSLHGSVANHVIRGIRAIKKI